MELNTLKNYYQNGRYDEAEKLALYILPKVLQIINLFGKYLQPFYCKQVECQKN